MGIGAHRKCVEHDFGRGVPLSGALAQEPLNHGGEVRADAQRRVDRRWLVVEDRVQRIDR